MPNGKMFKILSTIIRMRRKTTDIVRWSVPSSFSQDWESRNISIANHIPANSRLMDIGAGSMSLRRYLPPGCTYIPVDFIDRGYGTIIWDLNEIHQPALPSADVIVFSGVLEYIHDIPRIISYVQP